MAALFPALPVELVENIAVNLDGASIKKLRLTCKALSTTAFGPRFMSFMHNQITDLSATSLHNLEHLLNYEDTHAAVTSMTIQGKGFTLDEMQRSIKSTKLGHTYCKECNSNEWWNKPCKYGVEAKLLRLRRTQQELSRMNVSLTTERLASIFRRLGQLDNLNLEIVVETGSDDIEASTYNKPNWKSAYHTYGIVMSAIKKSQIKVTKLQIGSNAAPENDKVDILSRSMITYHKQLPIGTFAPFYKHIKSFTIGTTGWTRANMHDYVSIQYIDWLVDALGMLERMPNLEALDFRIFNREPLPRMQDIICEMLSIPNFEQLKSLKLHGLDVNMMSFGAFLWEHTKVEHIALSQIMMMPGIDNGIGWVDVLPEFANLSSLKRLDLVHLLWPSGRYPMTAFNLEPFFKSEGVVEWKDKWAFMDLSGCKERKHYQRQFQSTPLIVANSFSREDLDKGLRMVRDPRGTSPLYSNTKDIMDPGKTRERIDGLEMAWQGRVELKAKEAEAEDN